MTRGIRQTSLLLLCACFIGLPIFGQTNNSMDFYRENDSFLNLTLPFDANIVYTFFQDEEGMMWIGTKRGLFGYNGHVLHRYLNEYGPDGNSIVAIVQVSKEHLCVATDFGLFYFNLLTECYETPYTEWEELGAIRSIALFDDCLWIGTRDNGLFSFDSDTRTLKKENLQGLNEKLIYALEPVGDKLFIGSYDALSYYDKTTRKREEIELTKENKLIVYSLLWDHKRQCVWVGTEGELFKYDTHRRTAERVDKMPTSSYKKLAMDANGVILAGTNMGMYVYDPDTKTYSHIVHDTRNKQSLHDNVVNYIMCDHSGNIWIATDHGVSITHTTSDWNVVHLSEIVPTGEGNVFTALLVDSRGDYWMGGEDGLIHIKQKGRNEGVDWFKADDPLHPLKHNYIRMIYEDLDHDIWIATDGSIARYDITRNTFDFYALENPIGKKTSNWAYDIFEDAHGRLWVATYLGGLFVVDKKELLANGTQKPFTKFYKHLTDSNGLSDMVYRMFPDDYGKMWLNTLYGLMSVDMNSFSIDKKNIFVDNFLLVGDEVYFSSQRQLYCYDILADNTERLPFVSEGTTFSFVATSGRVWFTCVDGIYYIDTDDKKVYRYGNMETNCMVGFFDKHCDELLWGGEDCIVRISLANNVDNDGASWPVRITAITRDGDLLLPHTDYEGDNPLYGTTIRMEHRGNITLELSTLSYRHIFDDETFYYKINSDPWQRLERGATHLTFLDLAGGEYRIYLSSSNPDEDANAIVSTYHLYVPYPWYASSYAIVTYALLVALIVFLAVRFVQRRNKRKYVQREKEKSLELSNMKIDFFTNISHELKTPLSLIIAPLSKLISETTQETKRHTLQSIYDNAMRLNTLTHQILDFKQIEYESEDTLIRSRIELRTLVESCISTFSAIVNERKISLSLVTDIDNLWLNIDQVKIESAIINIISNAIKHVPEDKGEIVVRLNKNTHEAIITVKDNGTGIAESDLPLVFVHFFQGKDHSEGQGIGLYLTKKYVELHEGQIKLHNNNSGGLTVDISLPITDEKMNPEEYVAQSDEENKGKKLLIIDDNKEIVAFLSEALSRQYSIATAYDGKEGLAAVEKCLPDLIIVDQMMPEMDGLEFARNVRHNYPTSSLPIIMLTARDDTDTELRSIRIGIDAFIAKPFDFNILRMRIEQLLKKRETIEKAIRIETLSSPEFVPDESRDPDEMLLDRVTKAIEDNMSRDDFNVSMLTSTIGIDSKQLYRKIKQLTGLSPVNYIKKLKMKKAAMLLSQNRFTISEVVYMVGYTNASYFTKCFVEEYGITPKQFVAGARSY